MSPVHQVTMLQHCAIWFHSVVVITFGSDPNNPGSNPGGTSLSCFAFQIFSVTIHCLVLRNAVVIEIGISNSLSRHGMELPPSTVKRRVVVITFLGFHTSFLACMNITANWNCSFEAVTLHATTLVPSSL